MQIIKIALLCFFINNFVFALDTEMLEYMDLFNDYELINSEDFDDLIDEEISLNENHSKEDNDENE